MEVDGNCLSSARIGPIFGYSTPSIALVAKLEVSPFEEVANLKQASQL